MVEGVYVLSEDEGAFAKLHYVVGLYVSPPDIRDNLAGVCYRDEACCDAHF